MHSDPFIDHLDDLQKDFELGEGTALRNGESVTDSLDKERLDLDPLHRFVVRPDQWNAAQH